MLCSDDKLTIDHGPNIPSRQGLNTWQLGPFKYKPRRLPLRLSLDRKGESIEGALSRGALDHWIPPSTLILPPI